MTNKKTMKLFWSIRYIALNIAFHWTLNARTRILSKCNSICKICYQLKRIKWNAINGCVGPIKNNNKWHTIAGWWWLSYLFYTYGSPMCAKQWNTFIHSSKIKLMCSLFCDKKGLCTNLFAIKLIITIITIMIKAILIFEQGYRRPPIAYYDHIVHRN